MTILGKNENFGQKWKFWSKMKNFGNKNENCQKIEIVFENT